MRSYLLDEWKNGSGLIAGSSYVAVAQMPDAIEVPTLSVLKNVDGKLCIPSDVRQRWLQDPIRNFEWKKILGKFDQHHGQVSSLSPPVGVSADAVVTSGSDAVVTSGSDAVVTSGSDLMPPEWADEPTTLEAMLRTYTVASTFSLSEGGLVAKVVEGPKLFIAAPVAGAFDTESPLLCHGAGAWLLDEKAKKAMQEPILHCINLISSRDIFSDASNSNSLMKTFIITIRDKYLKVESLCDVHVWQESPIKVHVASFENDQALCVLEVGAQIFFVFLENCFVFLLRRDFLCVS